MWLASHIGQGKDPVFRQITLRNYRTHRRTSITLHPITLLIGNNSSGKSNILQGIRHLSHLVRRSDPCRSRADSARVRAGPDYFRHRYRLAEDNDPTAWSVSWHGSTSSVDYELELLKLSPSSNFIRCRERIEIQTGSGSAIEIDSGFKEDSNRLELRTSLENSSELPTGVKTVCREFFGSLGGAFSYHLQPSFLNGASKGDFTIASIDNCERVWIPSAIGYEGGRFQELIFHARESEERVFSRFVALVRRFNDDFHSVRLNDKNVPIWEFDLGSPRTDRPVEEFTPDLLSDGFLKAAAVALIVSAESPPSIVMLEEIENGVNPGNISEIMHWLWQAASAHPADGKSQFILTSHSPSILREFSENLENVYTLRLDKKTYQSDVRNLNTSLETLVGIGTIDGTVIEDDQGKRIVEIPPYQLTDLWYSGTIG